MLDFKMFKPIVFTWIEKTHESILVFFQHCSYVRTLIGIANWTGIGKVTGCGFATVLEADNMLKMKFH